ncbi:MAG: DUF2069 domain-containing protein [Neisseriaceae bacterium]|nr:DUF2069 domain-containing protein [Neisseriaceae bacterium]
MKSKYFLILLNIFLFALIALTLLWEWQIAPIRQGGSWLMLKAVPLSLFVSGCLKPFTPPYSSPPTLYLTVLTTQDRVF